VVHYIDYNTDRIRSGNVLVPFMHKRKSYEHEKEIRGVISIFPDLTPDGGWDVNAETIESGIEIEVDLERLIERIYVAPNAPAWFAELVRAVVSRYGCEFEVVQSSLDDDPVF